MCYFVLSFSLPNVIAQTGGKRGGRELLEAKLLIEQISNKATGMFNKSEPLEVHPSEVFQVK